ncbi:MAG: hypothetical protein K5750_08880 [Eubacterium sp.]|nr:hypothetical protein [Eubacterium sp.]
MGAGYHGGFGGDTRNRIGHPVSPTEKTLDMALSPKYYAETIVKKLNIHLKGSGKSISIVYNPDLPPGVAGRTKKSNPYVIEIGPSALTSETELANTIAHELNHARSFIRGGNAPERKAYRSGNALEKYMKGKR